MTIHPQPCVCELEAQAFHRTQPLPCHVCGRGQNREDSMSDSTKVKLKAAEVDARKNELVEVDRKIQGVEAEKAKSASEFNEELKKLRKRQTTLLNSIESGWEEKNAQTDLFDDSDADDDFDDEPPPAESKPQGRSKKSSKRSAKKGAGAAA